MTVPSLRRLVYYVHGFDRRGPRFFNLWQKREARAYRARFGGDLQIGDLDGNQWPILGQGVETEFHFLDWTEIISGRFDQPYWRGMGVMVSLLTVSLRQGLFGKIWRADRMIGLLMIWAFFPILLLLFCLLLAAFGGVVEVVVVACIGMLMFWLLHRFDHYFGVYYATNIAWAARRIALRDAPDLEARLAEFKATLAGADADEVVLVGHSIGAALALRLLEEAPADTQFLSVGQSIPLVSLQSEAAYVREALGKLEQRGSVWIDISAGRDPLGFHGGEPTLGCARSFSAHFSRSFGEQTLRGLKWRGFDMHFLYFKAPEVSGAPFDWFAILSGKMRLEERFSRARGLGEGGKN